MEARKLLEDMIGQGASDVFVVAGLPVAYRVDGCQRRLEGERLRPADTEDFVSQIYALANRPMQPFEDARNHGDDFSFAIGGVGRFRINVFRQRGSLGAVIRVIPFALPTAEELHLPSQVMDLADLKKGLVLITGPAGAGKSSTLACIIDRLNRTRSGHIITMEDTIEFVHSHQGCIVTQREVPTDVATYAEAMRSAMREAPDVMLLGEMRDAETIATAMTAAEIGPAAVQHAAHHRRRQHRGPHRGRLPAQPAAADPHAAVHGAASRGQPAAGAHRGRRRGACLRDRWWPLRPSATSSARRSRTR